MARKKIVDDGLGYLSFGIIKVENHFLKNSKHLHLVSPDSPEASGEILLFFTAKK
ncbi:hypothetical protein C8C87_0189 [Flavobacterium sp. 120]|nr:hypothetical protein C8C87_0189 [Flavobacterium sp. 120]